MTSPNAFLDLTETLGMLDGSVGVPDDFDSVEIESVIVSFSNDPKFRYALIEWIAKSHNNTTKRKRKEVVRKALGFKDIRQVERLLKQYKKGELQENCGKTRSDKGKVLIDPYWLQYMEEYWKKSLGEKEILRGIDIYRELKRHAEVDGRGKALPPYPHYVTVYRIVNPWIDERDRAQGKRSRNPGSGSWLAVTTKNGKMLKADYSNQIIQADHTKLDIFILDEEGNPYRPWLTIIVDTFSSSLLGYFLGARQPGTNEVALALRHAAMPKQCPSEYLTEEYIEILQAEKIPTTWGAYGLPSQCFFTDGGRDLAKAKHMKQIGRKFDFECETRRSPKEGGIVERWFKTINNILRRLGGFIEKAKDKDAIEKAQKGAFLRRRDLRRVLDGFFWAYNHEPYPRDKRHTRYERWVKGLGGVLPAVLDEEELDVCLMKEETRVVQELGSISFKGQIYRGECLKDKKYLSETVTVRVDYEHALRLRVYINEDETYDRMGAFLGFVDALNLEYQDLSLDELEGLGKGKKDPDNFASLLELGFRNELNERGKKDKQTRQREEQKRSRRDAKPASNNVVSIKNRTAKSTQSAQPPSTASKSASANQTTTKQGQLEAKEVPAQQGGQAEPIVLIPLRTSSYDDW
ncbi:Mu transposase C-terminal domain-containing protein [Leptolyngbya sp. FACHB-321]|uniref:Mu transposase C-terminal domain-containing protein n=1 Tax=Leptolyngbya sp. FACHB-321 TaxID=2692807 RepID=UPI0016845E9B|nr:Mu transposase C-terminal domain-containing protein [Leptolyngbya sp. FACHB-321]MBD2038225.1 Mu transposase C-terminal domain-containing protein [Leptolyngbya sp. FACHB-321]